MMILKNKVPELRLGYPTVSDKYNVAGGVLAATSAPADFGRLLKFTETSGVYALADTVTDVSEIAGVNCATNVKLADPWTDKVTVYPGEAVNIMFDGYITIQLASTLSKVEEIKAGAPVYFKTDTGDACTNGDAGALPIPHWAFTGKYQTSKNALDQTVLIAEVELIGGNFAK